MISAGDKWSETITVEEAFRAVRELIFIYWEAGGKSEDQIAIFGSAIDGDPALEDDWLDAIAKVRS